MTYDEVGNLLTYRDTSGTTTYRYDAANQLTGIQENGVTCPAAAPATVGFGCIYFEYDSNALETKRITPGGANTVTTRDAAGRPTRITAKDSAGAVAVDIGYSYAAPGTTNDRLNVQTRTAFKEEGITAGAVTTYTYDSKNQLVLAAETAGATQTASWGYSYDAAGNRTSQTRNGATGAPAGSIDYGYNAANQLISTTGQSTTWTYDGAGNQTRNGDTGITSTFGDRQQVTASGSTPNSYFGTGNTNRTAAGSVDFSGSALGLAERTVTAGTLKLTQGYTRTPDGEATSVSITRQYYIKDHLGSVVGLFNSDGAYVGGYTYSPYGEARFTSTNSNVASNSLRYIGEYHDGDGIYKLGARYYDASLGRFTQMDPTGQETNPYAYGGFANPINGKDPSGTAFSQEDLVAIALLVLATSVGGLYGVIISVVGIFGDDAYYAAYEFYTGLVNGGCSLVEDILAGSTGYYVPLC